MSKLIQHIGRLGKTAPAPMGFGAAARREATPAMVIVGATADRAGLGGLDTSSLDAVLYQPDSPGVASAAGDAKALGEGTWGVSLDAPTAEGVQALVDAGCDFVVINGTDAPLAALHHEELGRILVVDYTLSKETARALDPLPLDAVLLSEPLSGPLSLEDLLRLSALRGEIALPFLLAVRGPFTAWDIESLREVGVEGLVPDLGTAGAEELAGLAKVVRGLPRRRNKGDRSAASLPRIRMAAGPPQEDMPDDDDDDEDF